LTIGLTGGAAVLIVLSGRPDYAQLLLQLLLTATFSMTWNIIGGLGGQHSFAQPIFFGVGAYAGSLLLVHDANFPLPLAMLVGAAAATAFGFLLSPCFRASGPYFAILTVAVAEGLRVAMNSFGPGGTQGIYLPISASPPDSITLLFGAGVFVLAAAVFMLFQYSTVGVGLRMIDVDAEAASAIGVPIVRLKILALVAGAPFIGAFGPLFAASQTFIDPDSVFDLNLAVVAILATLLGGIGTYWGPIVGSLAWQALAYGLRHLIHDPGLILMINGAVLIAVIAFMPQGLTGFAYRLGGLTSRFRLLRAKMQS
jgi:branched-chain amino acid transport system permease protein